MGQWDIDKPSIPGNQQTIGLKDILYEYDGPLIFVANEGLNSQLFYKMDDLPDGSQLFLATSTSSKVINAMKEGRLSVKGAISEGSHFRVVNVSPGLQILRFWECELYELEEDELPRPGVGLAHTFGAVPDSLNQSSSFFSVRLAGEALHRGTMSFSVYNALINNIYEACRRILSFDIEGTREFRIDYPVFEPSFGSVIVSIQEPVVLPRSKEASPEERSIITDRVATDIRKNRNNFFNGIEKIISRAKKGELSTEFAKDNFNILDQIKEIIPFEGSETIESLEFNGSLNTGLKSFSIDEETGDKIRRAHKIVEKLPRTLHGTIVEFNSQSGTFIVLSSDRLITCVFTPDIYYVIRENLERYKIGAKVKLTGLVVRRPRRDKMHVREIPVIIHK